MTATGCAVTPATALARAADALAAAGVEEARLEARLLLERCLGLSRAALYAQLTRVVAPAALAAYEALVARRASREPLAYVLGTRAFAGLELLVDPRVLVPRPETELLVEAAARLLPPGGRAADVGTGSGAIAVALALLRPDALVDALDVSAAALAVAAANVRRHAVAERVRLLQGDLLAPLSEPVDLVVANLPYVPTGDLAGLQPEVAREPRLALDGGPDGLSLYRRLLAQAPGYLRAGRPGPTGEVERSGALLLEIGAGQGELAASLARAALPGAAVSVARDWAGHDRVVSIRLA